MTTIAMVAGMMPSALAFGAGGEFRSPMALAVIGGLIFSTILSLLFVPAMFAMMDDVGALIWRFGSKLLASSGEGEHDASADRGADHKPPPTIVHRRQRSEKTQTAALLPDGKRYRLPEVSDGWSLKPKDLADASFVDELDRTGYIARLYSKGK